MNSSSSNCRRRPPCSRFAASRSARKPTSAKPQICGDEHGDCLRCRPSRLPEAPISSQTTQAVRRLNLRDRVRWLEYSPTGSDFESGFLLYKLLRQEFPQAYEKRLRLRPAPLLRLILENRYPRLVATTRLGGLHGKSAYYGPFPTRAAAEKFSSGVLDFFKVRRCTEELNPDPAFPGCIYSEMKMCLAPCFRGCTDEVYASEVSQLEHFLSTGGRSLLYRVAAERDRASQALEFETAAAMHTRFEKVQALMRELPEIVHRLDQLRGVMIQPSPQPGSVALFKIEGARILEEGYALRAVDIDIIYLNGYGFPAYRGGPMWYADTVGLPKVYRRICEFHQQHGELWTPAPLLQRLAEQGKTFAEFDKEQLAAA